MTEIKKKDGRGRKPMLVGDRKVFLRCGIKRKHKKEVEKLLIEISKQFS